MNIRRMRMLVLFDLPTTMKDERKVANQFRKFLLREGFYFLQFSCYVRICANYTDAQKHEQRLKQRVPSHGTVRSMIVTEKQYLEMKEWIGQKSSWTDQPESGEQLAFF